MARWGDRRADGPLFAGDRALRAPGGESAVRGDYVRGADAPAPRDARTCASVPPSGPTSPASRTSSRPRSPRSPNAATPMLASSKPRSKPPRDKARRPASPTSTNLAAAGLSSTTHPFLGPTMRVADQLRTPDTAPQRHGRGGTPAVVLVLLLAVAVLLAGTVGYIMAVRPVGAEHQPVAYINDRERRSPGREHGDAPAAASAADTDAAARRQRLRPSRARRNLPPRGDVPFARPTAHPHRRIR